jgi:hypothetical protein
MISYPCNLSWPILILTDKSVSLAVPNLIEDGRLGSVKDNLVDLSKQSVICWMSSGLL